MDHKEISAKLQGAMSSVAGLPSGNVENIEVLIYAGELLLAFEDLCTQLYEYSIVLDRRWQHEMTEIGKFLGAQEIYIASLRGDASDPAPAGGRAD